MDSPQGSIQIPIETDLHFQRALSGFYSSLGTNMALTKPLTIQILYTRVLCWTPFKLLNPPCLTMYFYLRNYSWQQMPTCTSCSLKYDQSLVYCPNCGVNNVPPPVVPRRQPQKGPQHPPVVHQQNAQPQPQVVYVNQTGSSGFNVFMWLLVIIFLGFFGLVCLLFLLPGILMVMASGWIRI